MKTLIATLLSCILIGNVLARDPANRITPEIQAALDQQAQVIAQWAANPVLINAVKAQNAKGPVDGVTNAQWRKTPPETPLIQSFQKSPAGVWLAKKMAASNGVIREAFLSGAQGEKVAFVEKPTLYLHKGDPKFEVPMTGKPWQGKPEWDKSSSAYSVQLTTPVLDRGKPIGMLAVGVSMKALKATP